MAHRSSRMPGVVHNSAPLGQESFWRDEELLVVEEDADHEALRAELEGRGYDTAAGVRRYRLPDREVDELVARLREQPGPTPRVSVNHLFAAQHRPPWYDHGHETYHFANFEQPKPAAPPPGFLPAAEPGPVRVGILDTEVDHPLLRERTVLLGSAPLQLGMRTNEAYGHGTLVAGLIASRAPQAELVVGPVMDGNGVVEEFLVIQALDRPELRACSVVNISFAGYTEDDQPPPALSVVLDRYREQDGVVVAAAGNGGKDRMRWPAALPGVVAVGALDPSGARWHYSDHGTWIDVWAPGVGVVSTYLDAGWVEWSGTSAAAAKVSGAIAALIDQGVEPRSAVMRLREETAVVEKRVVPGERVRLDKETVTDQRQIGEEVRGVAMSGQPVHFEIPADDTAKGREFWGSLFDWQFEATPGPFEYHMTRISDQAGVAITDMEPGKRGIRPYFYVDDINASAARVKELGGEANEPGSVPGMGWFTTCRDPQGNEFGLWQNDPSAPAPTG